MTEKVCVIGAGVIGLSTALRIRHLLPGADVCVLASSFDVGTTSDGAAGLWEPYKLGDTPEEKVTFWAAETYHLFQVRRSDQSRQRFHTMTQSVIRIRHAVQELYDSKHCAVAGITQVPLTAVQTEGHEAEPPWRDIPGDYRALSAHELQRLSKKGR